MFYRESTYAAHYAALVQQRHPREFAAVALGAIPIGPSPFVPVGTITASPYNPTVPIFVSMTPNIYWASKDPRIQAQYGNPDVAVWQALAKLGLWIDHEIMVLNQDPPTIHLLRTQYGYTWVPRADQPNVTAPPFVHIPGVPDYNPKDTATHICTSVDKAAYPVHK